MSTTRGRKPSVRKSSGSGKAYQQNQKYSSHSKQENSFYPSLMDESSLATYFSMMQLNSSSSQKLKDQPQPLMYNQSSPFSDLGNMQNFLQMYMPRNRRSSLFPSETSDSSRRGWSDESRIHQQATRSYSSAAIERPIYRNENFSPPSSTYDWAFRSHSAMAKPSRSTTSPILPNWAIDSNGVLRNNISINRILECGDLVKFAMDKTGCQFVQDALRTNLPSHLLEMIFEQVIGRREVFMKLSTNMFGNFFIQQIIELSSLTHDLNYNSRQEKIKDYIGSRMAELCLDKSACRVVQYALETLDLSIACYLVQRLPRDVRLISICIDQNANHVIQKVVNVIPLQKWEFIVDFIAQPHHLRQICSDKYGCRVVQTIIEKLTTDSINSDLTISAQNLRELALQRIMTSVISKCSELATNEYANYIIQHIVSTDEMDVYREQIIEKCLMRNLLSLSQEKFASHVVEKAFLHAPLTLLAEMMDEIFDGYVPHPETGKDALDIMMFHQFGNYVIQCMLTICCESVSRQRKTKEGGYDYIRSFEVWLKKLQTRVFKEKNRLLRFSSGKKMIDTLQNLRFCPTSSSTSAQYSLNKYYSTASEDEDDDCDDSREEKMSVYLEKVCDENGHLGKKRKNLSIVSIHDHDGDDDESDNNLPIPPSSQFPSTSSSSHSRHRL
ncbi:unnamed protein product [Caenorhabditis angaria]|uniref:PUM-HD domain-containing protein n=1 Tax=Caenorhabditis angaria TaxID=860376 RepID=A0A9P1N2B0_9PELO|nr:unnamed protein product [Caenorhabditis angaria]